MKPEKRRTWRQKLKRFLILLFIFHLFYIIICKWMDPPFTITQVVNILQGNGFKRDYINYDEMGKNIKLAVMAGEDQLFPEHNGFDMKAIDKAMKWNEKHPNKKRGASTLSQQTAKNVFLWQGGGFFRKGLEVYYTFMIEKIWGKKRILETYLNVAEMGKGVFGVQAAAKKYFNKDAADLTRQEAAQIAGCLPNPKKYTVKPLSKYVQIRSGLIVRYMNGLAANPEVKAVINK